MCNPVCNVFRILIQLIMLVLRDIIVRVIAILSYLDSSCEKTKRKYSISPPWDIHRDEQNQKMKCLVKRVKSFGIKIIIMKGM